MEVGRREEGREGAFTNGGEDPQGEEGMAGAARVMKVGVLGLLGGLGYHKRYTKRLKTSISLRLES